MPARTEPVPAARILVVDRGGELAARLRRHVMAAGTVVRSCPDPARAEGHLAAAPWDAVVAGPSLMHRAGLRRLASLHSRHPWVAKVLALHERPRADLAEIIHAGASDLIPLHATDDEFRRALARAARITRSRRDLTAPPGPAGRGRTVMVCSASGGCGKTFVATNAAEFLTRITGRPVVLVDLDLQFGEVSTALRLRPEVTITDALAAEAEGFDLEDVLDDFLLSHPDGFKVLAAPRRPAEADSVTPGGVTRILDALRARRAWVVIDTHEGLSDPFAAALGATDHVLAVATPDRPSLVNLSRYLGALERLGMAAGNISVVLNKAETDLVGFPPPGFDPGDGAVGFDRRFEAVVPYSREVLLSVNVGVPLIVGKPKSPISARLIEAFSALLPGTRPTPEMTPPTPGPAPTTESAPAAGAEVPAPASDPPAERHPPAGPPDAPVGTETADRPPDGAGEPTDIDLTDTPTGRCSAVAPARRRRCRRKTGPAISPPGRGPPPIETPRLVPRH